VKASPSPWFFGLFALCLTQARPVDFVPMAGKLGFFEVDCPWSETA
jgi:hypothetical protein